MFGLRQEIGVGVNMIFKKKTEADIVAKDRRLIDDNSKAVGKLVILINNNDELISKLKDLEEKLKYLKPVNTIDAMEEDIKIGNKIDDLKIELSRINGETSPRVNTIISEIMVLIINRKY